MLKLANKDIKTVITTAFHMFEKQQKKLSVLKIKERCRKYSQTIRAEGSIMCEVNKIVGLMTKRLCVVQETISEGEDIAESF